MQFLHQIRGKALISTISSLECGKNHIKLFEGIAWKFSHRETCVLLAKKDLKLRFGTQDFFLFCYFESSHFTSLWYIIAL